MNVMQQGLIALMKSAILEQPQPLPEEFEIQAAMPLIQKHHIAALVYDGAVRCGLPRENPAMEKLFRAYYRFLVVSEGQEREIRRIFRAFEESGIDYLPLKGCNMKALYPKPEMRAMGDADILIRLEQYDRIEPVMKALGFERKNETDHELVWVSPQLHLELHKHLIPSHARDLYAYFEDGWHLAVPGSGSRWDMSPEDTFVYLFAHFAKHYRGGGIGCRYVLDLWVYLRANPGLDMDRILAALEKLKLREFYGNISRLMAVWFEGAEPDDRTEFMTEFIFASGSWGQMDQRLLARGVNIARRTSQGKLRYLWQRVFLKPDEMKWLYPILRKAPWLLPGAWIWRIVRKVAFQRSALSRQKQILEGMSREKVEDSQRLLQYVGLDCSTDS